MRLRLACSFAVISLLLAWGGAAMAQATRTLTGVVITTDGGGGVSGATIQIKDKPLTATAGADGTFTLAKVPVTDVVIQVSAEGYIAVEIPVKAGRGNTVFAASLSKQLPPPPPPTRAVTVLVRDSATGAAIANATVKVQGTEVTAQTDADGLFVLKDMSANDVVLDITAADHNPSSVTVASADTAAKVALTSSLAPAPAPAPAPPPAPALTDEELAALSEAEAESNPDGEVIVVTGSAIERREVTTSAPVSVVDKKDLESAGLATVGDILQNLPAQSNGINAQANNGGDGSTRVNIRGLGTNRTLTLINGRRVVSGGTGADLSVDLNAIPLAVIERVEILKDGASAIYGSDAIGGVVNVITRNDLNGSEATIYTGTSTRGDGFGYDISLVTGTTSKKGNVLFSAGYQNQEPVFAGDRSFSDHDKAYDYEAKEQSNSGSSAILGGRLNTKALDKNGDGKPDPGVNVCGLKADGTPIQYCRRQGADWVPYVTPGDFYNYQPDNYLYTPSERYNVFSTGSYKVTQNVRAFFEGSYINRKSDQRLAPEPFFGDSSTPISSKSVYNQLGVTVLGYNRRLQEFGPRRQFENIDTFRIVTGLDGAIPESVPGLADWKWDLSFNFGRTQGTQQNSGNLIVSRLATALGPSYFDANGVARCGVDADNTIAGCVPLNLLAGADAKAVTKDMIKYVTFTGVSSGYNRQQTLLGNLHGRLAKTPWGGDIALAVGADYRREGGGFTPDPLTSTGDTTGNASQPTDGSLNVKEGYAELSAVPVVGKGAVQWLEVNLAARAFDYNTFGSGVTWKVGGLFRTVGGLGLRGTYSTAFRAPGVAELYAGLADGFPQVEDPCDTTPPSSDGPVVLTPTVAAQCAKQNVPIDAAFGTAQQRSVSGGNPNLKQETAKVLTAGLVFEPPAVKGLAFTVDYFNVDITDAIQALGSSVILANCYNRGLDQFCANVKRDAANGYVIDFIDDAVKNVGGNATSGVDFSVAYDHSHNFGRFRHSFEGTYLRNFDVDNTLQVLHYKGNYDAGVYPDLKTNFTTTWAKDGVSAGFNIRFVSSYDECDAGDCNSLATEDAATRAMLTRKVDANTTADIFAGYTTKTAAGVTSLSVGMNNVLDQDPPLIYTGFAGDSDSSTYDYMGRFVYARMSQQF
jgi:iron complex outermembrane recepter protein